MAAPSYNDAMPGSSSARSGGSGSALSGGGAVEAVELDPSSGANFFNADFKKHDDLKQMLDSSKDSAKLDAMRRIISMVRSSNSTVCQSQKLMIVFFRLPKVGTPVTFFQLW